MDYYNIRYSICNFKVKLDQNAKLNSYKVSGIRGIIGQELLNRHCVSDKNCKNCNFINYCVPFNFYNMPLKAEVTFIATDRVPPYVIICDDNRECINKGEEIIFQIIFFSDSISFIPEVIRSIRSAGQNYGLYNNKYTLIEVTNDCNEYIFNGEIIYLTNIKWRLLSEYIDNRLSISTDIDYIKIVNPLRYKKNGKLAKDIEPNDLIDLLIRRIVVLNALEGNKVNIDNNYNVSIRDKTLKWQENDRYSNRQNAKMKLGGIVGNILIDTDDIDFKRLLIAGELVHIGKSTAFGLGDYFLY